MKKVILVALKDLNITLRDRAAWIMMVAAPLILTVVMGFVSGNLGGQDSGLQNIPVALVNQDGGELGVALAEYLSSPGLNDILAISELNAVKQAQSLIEADKLAAVIVVPRGFTASLLSGSPQELLQIEIIANPARPISTSVVERLVASFVNEVESGRIAGEVRATMLGQPALAISHDLGQTANPFTAVDLPSPLLLEIDQVAALEETSFDPLAYFATGMAVFFLMYTVTIGARSLLAERVAGTLPRMLLSPTSTAQILGGKVLGIFLLGLLQVCLLIGATGLLFDLRWGDPVGVLLLVAAVVAAATGWGILIASSARTPAQIATLGTVLMLLFGILGGTFVSIAAFGDFLQTLSWITPHAWALQGFELLGRGAGLAEIRSTVLPLLGMALALFAAAVLIARRRWTSAAM